MTTLYLAYNPGSRSTLANLSARGLHPPVLVSFWYLANWESQCRVRPEMGQDCGPLMLDSGAYSAWNAGKEIDLDALIAESLKPRWAEVVGLDVVGDADATLLNARRMWAAGSRAIPVFHIGEPWEMLAQFCAEFPKVGLSCRFGEPLNDSLRWVEECFARAWPHRFHSFGWVKTSVLRRYPFHSADATSWYRPAAQYGKWLSYPGLKGSRGNSDFTVEAERFLRFSRELRARWGKVLDGLENPDGRAPSPSRQAVPGAHH